MAISHTRTHSCIMRTKFFPLSRKTFNYLISILHVRKTIFISASHQLFAPKSQKTQRQVCSFEKELRCMLCVGESGCFWESLELPTEILPVSSAPSITEDVCLLLGTVLLLFKHFSMMLKLHNHSSTDSIQNVGEVPWLPKWLHSSNAGSECEIVEGKRNRWKEGETRKWGNSFIKQREKKTESKKWSAWKIMT